MPGMVHVYVGDVDEAYQRALDAGATSVRAPEDQFYGDRNAGVKDRCGNQWWISTHKEDLTADEIAKRAAGKH
jgi:PhnB protein